MKFESIVHRWYKRWLRPLIPTPIHQQRLKFFWFCWGYWPLLFLKSLPVIKRFEFLYKFFLIDWEIEHAHKPGEIFQVLKFISKRPAQNNEIVLEAGCWKGGSTAKLSIFCNYFGFKLHIYDSFQGVEPTRQPDHDFSGEYSASEDEVLENLDKYGIKDVCTIHKGWFSKTLKPGSVNSQIRTVYMDCDLAKGTKEVLAGVLPMLVDDGAIFTQDFHILPVMQLLTDSATWKELRTPIPAIEHICYSLAIIIFQ